MAEGSGKIAHNVEVGVADTFGSTEGSLRRRGFKPLQIKRARARFREQERRRRRAYVTSQRGFSSVIGMGY